MTAWLAALRFAPLNRTMLWVAITAATIGIGTRLLTALIRRREGGAEVLASRFPARILRTRTGEPGLDSCP